MSESNSTMDFYLPVPIFNMGQRRSSEGYLSTQNMLSHCEDEKSEPQVTRRRGTNPSLFDGHFFDVLKKNYEFVSALADIENHHSTEEDSKDRKEGKSHSMVRGGPITRTASPRPLILQQIHKWRNEESSSISSAESVLDGLSTSSDREISQNAPWQWMRDEAKLFVNDLIDAFEDRSSQEATNIKDQQKLSAVQLKKDLKRFYLAIQPYLEVLSALHEIIMWKNPLSTLLLVLIIVYSLFRGWTISLLLFLFLFQLTLNYLKTVKNINVGWMFLPRKSVVLPKCDKSGAQLIFDIAKFAQSLLRFATNLLEKLESLLMFKNQKVSMVFYGLVVYWLAWSILFATGTCLGWTILAIGIRIFFTTYLFEKFPKLRKRLDTYGYFWNNLPLRSSAMNQKNSNTNTNISSARSERSTEPKENYSGRSNLVQMGEQFSSRLGSNFNLDQNAAVNLLLGPNHRRLNSERHSLSFDSNSQMDYNADYSYDSSSAREYKTSLHASSSVPTNTIAPNEMYPFDESTSNSTVHDNLSERPSIEEEYNDEHMSSYTDPIIDNVFAFRSCVMNEREKLFPFGITSGILYLTDSALVFQSRNNSDEKEHFMILFHDIRHIKKIQSLRSMSLITGTRKSLEIIVEGRRKPVQFIGLAKRDDFVTRIQLMCRNAGAVVDFTE